MTCSGESSTVAGLSVWDCWVLVAIALSFLPVDTGDVVVDTCPRPRIPDRWEEPGSTPFTGGACTGKLDPMTRIRSVRRPERVKRGGCYIFTVTMESARATSRRSSSSHGCELENQFRD